MLDRPTPSEESSLARQQVEPSMEVERMHDVFLLLENLLKREEATAKVILDCLYDVGSINLINRKVRFRPMNRFVKWIARLSKPAFRMVAMRWVRRNSPRLITNWLHSQVKFEPRKTLKTVIIAPPPSAPLASPPQPVQTVSLIKLEDYNREIKRLHGRIKMLVTLLIGVTVSLGGSIAWSFLRAEANLPQQVQQIQEAFRPCSSSKSIRLIEACK